VKSIESGVFRAWESPPEWFIHAAAEKVPDRHAPKRSGRHWWVARIRPLSLGLRLDLVDGVLHKVDVKVEPDGDSYHGVPVSLDTLSRYDYIRMGP
jgi:hypothetical protein